MEFFTPELIARLGSLDDSVADAADAEWEEAVERYDEQLQAIRPRLPTSLCSLFDTYYLHDATVLSMGQQSSTFVIVLRLDAPSRELLILTYALLDEARINKESLPPETRCNYIQWMYDEVDWTGSEPGHARHNILLSNGWEIELHLAGFQLTAARPLIPVPASSEAAGVPASV